MSGKNCIQKTNEELFGAIGRFLIGATTTSEGQRNTLFTIVVLAIMGAEFMIGMTILTGVMDAQLPNFGIMIGGAVFLAVVMMFTMVYAMTLHDNCTSDNEESE